MGLIIRKKITLEFLGEEYKDSYLVFRSIPVGDLLKVQKAMPKEGESDEKQMQAIPKMVEVLEEYFLEGKVLNEKVEKDDVKSLDAETAIHCFQAISGVETNLESRSRSSSAPSTNEDQPEPNPQ